MQSNANRLKSIRNGCVQPVTLDKLLLENEAASKVHPAVLRLGLKYADGSIVGANARCLAMLQAFSQVIEVRRVPHFRGVS